MKGSRVLWALVLLSAVVWSASSSACDSRCVCYDDVVSDLKAANCSNVHYHRKSFSDLLKNVQILRIHDDSENRGIFSHTWSSCHDLEELYIDHNHQTSLSPWALKNCKKLRVLDVSNNKISKASQINSLLKELPNLESLVLRGNPITALPDLASSSLTSLDLSYCNLNVVGERSFAKLGKLHALNLEGNKLKKFKIVLPASLRVLNLMLNDIATISPVEHFFKLKVLELAGNPLQCRCDLVSLRNEETGEFVNSRHEATCVGPKSMLGLPWTKARKHCELNHQSRRYRRDMGDQEEGSGHEDPNEEGYDESREIYSDELDSDGNIPDTDDHEYINFFSPNTEIVDSKLSGTVEETDEITQSSAVILESADHSTSPTTESGFIPHEHETDDATKAEEPVVGSVSENGDTDPEETENDETENTESDKQAENVIEEEDNDDDNDDLTVPEKDLPDKSENSKANSGEGEAETDDKTEEEEDDDNDDDYDNDDLIVPAKDLPDESENSKANSGEGEAETDDKTEEVDDDDYDDHILPGKDLTDKSDISEVNAGEEEAETDKPETDDNGENKSIINFDITDSEHENVKQETEEDEGSEDKEKDEVKIDTVPEEDDDFVEPDYESPTEDTPLDVTDEVEESKGVEVDEGSQHSTADETSTAKWNDDSPDLISESEEDEEDISPINAPGDDNETIPSVEHTIYKDTVMDVESEKWPDSEDDTRDEGADYEGSGTDSDDGEPAVTPSTKNVSVSQAGRGRQLFVGGVVGAKEGEDGEASQATTKPGPEVSHEGTEAAVVTDATVETEDANEKISLESPESAESPVTSTGSYVVLGLIMVLIVFLLGYAVYKSRLGRRRSDGDSRTIKEKDVELGKGNDRELQDVSKPLLVTPPAAAVNGKSDLQQPLVSKPTENPQLKDDANDDDKKNSSPLQSRYHIYETLNGDKERIEVPPPANAATIPVTTSPKKSPSPTRTVSKLPPPRDADSPGPNMYGGGGDTDTDDGEVFLKNNHNGDLGSPRSCRVTVVQGDLSVPKKPVFVVNPGAAASSGVV